MGAIEASEVDGVQGGCLFVTMDGALFEASAKVSEVDGVPGGRSFGTTDSGGQGGAIGAYYCGDVGHGGGRGVAIDASEVDGMCGGCLFGTMDSAPFEASVEAGVGVVHVNGGAMGADGVCRNDEDGGTEEDGNGKKIAKRRTTVKAGVGVVCVNGGATGADGICKDKDYSGTEEDGNGKKIAKRRTTVEAGVGVIRVNGGTMGADSVCGDDKDGGAEEDGNGKRIAKRRTMTRTADTLETKIGEKKNACENIFLLPLPMAMYMFASPPFTLSP